MKATIENFPVFYSPDVVKKTSYELSKIIEIVNDCNNLDELREELKNKKFEYFFYGFGSNHCWVHHVSHRDIRILFITE